MSAEKRETLDADQFKQILNNMYSYDLQFKKYYPNRDELLLFNVSFSEDLLLNTIPTNDLNLTFIDCEFKSLDILDISAKNLTFKNTTIQNLKLTNSSLISIALDEKSKILSDLILIKSGIRSFTITCNIKKLEINSSSQQNTNLTLDKNVEKLSIQGANSLIINSIGLITDCSIQNCTYPFTKYVFIKTLTLINCIVGRTISGVFDEVSLSNSVNPNAFLNLFVLVIYQ